ncbi:MAG: DUF72 domain-containing protein [Pseudomonadota bacterium]|nr:DUF72 domain-containing protein [Pseudomonadota bacterium]
MQWHVGTSGWGYKAWEGTFYPEKIVATERLGFYAQHLDAVEINTTFYHLTSREQLLRWEAVVPRRFVFAVKGSRFITHTKRLKEPERSVPKMMDILSAQKKGGPIVFQLPPRFPKDAERLDAFLEVLPPTRRYAIEFRDPDWHCQEIYDRLHRRNVAFCLFEKGELRSPRVVTADFIYVRLHGRKEGYKGNYTDRQLREWRDWLAAQDRDVYIFFDNTDEKLFAVENAMALKEMVQ